MRFPAVSPGLPDKPQSGFPMGLFEWFVLKSEAALLQTAGQAVFCIIESVWLHGDQGVEEIKPYAFLLQQKINNSGISAT